MDGNHNWGKNKRIMTNPQNHSKKTSTEEVKQSQITIITFRFIGYGKFSKENKNVKLFEKGKQTKKTFGIATQKKERKTITEKERE